MKSFKFYISLLFVVVALPLKLSAQTINVSALPVSDSLLLNTVSADTLYHLTDSDSLQVMQVNAENERLKHEMDSLREVLAHSENAYRMFSPMVYYPDVTGRLFSLTSSEKGGVNSLYDKMVDDALVNLYLSHPEQVKTTVNRLHASASRQGDKPQKPVRRKVEIMQQEAPVGDSSPVGGSVELVVTKPNFWKFKGDYSLQFIQNYISDNWYQSGESNFSMIGNVVLQLNYDNKSKLKFDNTLEMKLGFQTSESDTLHKVKTSTDLLRYTGKLGVQASKNWYYTLQGIATTQFAYGLKSNDRNVYSDFCSPLTVNLSLGMDYKMNALKGKLTGSMHIAPLASNWKYVGRLSLAARNGIEEGKHSLLDYGSQFNVNLTWTPNTTLKWKTRLYAYTTYHRTELEWENNIQLSISRYISTNIFLYPRFDDGANRKNDSSYWQFKEYFALGFTYSM